MAEQRLIDANALMEELKQPTLIDAEKANRIWEGWHECTIAVKEAIDRTPTIEERKKGKWIDAEDFYLANCSVCGYQMDVHENRGYHNFCPNCGAEMKGEDHGAD